MRFFASIAANFYSRLEVLKKEEGSYRLYGGKGHGLATMELYAVKNTQLVEQASGGGWGATKDFLSAPTRVRAMLAACSRHATLQETTKDSPL